LIVNDKSISVAMMQNDNLETVLTEDIFPQDQNYKFYNITQERYISYQHRIDNMINTDDIINATVIDMDKKIKITVKTLTGKNIPLEIFPHNTIEELKTIICAVDGPPENIQRLIYNSFQMKDDDTVIDKGICDGSTVQLVLRLRGGMFHETSGHGGTYIALETLYFSLDDWE